MMMQKLLFWGLLPFIMPQAVYVRKTAPRFAGAGGPKTGVAGKGKPFHLVAVGDSIIAGVGAGQLADALVGQTALALSQMLDARVSWDAVGKIGITTRGVVDRLVPRLPDRNADFILLSAGVNDVTALNRVSTWRKHLSCLIEILKDRYPTAVIAVAGIPPLSGFPLLPQPMRTVFGIRGRLFDTAARDEISRHRHTVYVPLEFEPDPENFSSDGFHPSEDSYRLFGELAASHIIEEFNSKERVK